MVIRVAIIKNPDDLRVERDVAHAARPEGVVVVAVTAAIPLDGRSARPLSGNDSVRSPVRSSRSHIQHECACMHDGGVGPRLMEVVVARLEQQRDIRVELG